ncbi:predicted protein [Sclerotinia sclerotiorum 1980 UF-70]|nr:predicted protein [Sclerotinia sclerotiorum 1980 UF-70]EDN94949.1 predicted protein [Sclerotinia sclerotiorum 1980 UF-70]
MADGLDKRISGLGHGARESSSSFDNAPGNRGSIGHGQHPSFVRNSRTWRTVNTIDTDADKHRSATSVYSTAATDLLKFGYTTVSPTAGKEMTSIKTVPKSPRPPAPIWEQETGGSSRMSYNGINTRPVSRRGGVSPFFGGGGMASVRRKARRSYADSPTVPEEVHIGNEVKAAGTGINNDTLGITYPNGYSSAKEGTRQLRSYIQATFSKSRLKGSDSLASMDSRFESVSNSMQELQMKGDAKSQGDVSQSQSRHAQLHEMDRREREMGTGRGVRQANIETETGSDVFPSEFSAGSWESIGESTDVDSQPNFIRHGTEGTVPQVPQLPALGLGSSGTGTDGGIGARGRSNTLAIPSSPFLPNPFTPDLGASETQSAFQNHSFRRSTETDLKQNIQRDKNERDREAREESPTIGNLMVGPNARMVMGAGRRPISVDTRENKRISSTKAKIRRHGEGGESVVMLGSFGGSVGVASPPPSRGKGGGGNGMGMGKSYRGSEGDFSAYI